jgi:hypothetical protein
MPAAFAAIPKCATQRIRFAVERRGSREHPVEPTPGDGINRLFRSMLFDLQSLHV